MSGLRVASVSAFVLSLAIACGGAQSSGSSSESGSSRSRRATAEVCPATVVASTAACPAQVIPPGDGSATYQCRTDADCKSPSGTDGRCLKNPALGELTPASRGNLLGGPPPPPAPAICVFDYCHADADCGPKAKCVCGSGKGLDRNHCVPLDMCRADADCLAENVCLCGTRGNANYCVEGDCHQDGDCDDGFKCENNHCHSKKDTCKSSADCPPTAEGPRTCRWGRETKHFDCHVVPPIPPG